MKCEEVSKELIAYLDRRANSAERVEVEGHLATCNACRTRAEDFRKVWNVLDEMPVEEPSLGFDARLRQRIADEPRPGWFRWLVPQPRLALSMALLVALCVWVSRLPRDPSMTVTIPPAPVTEQQQYQVIENL
jgi:anti-sigma factor RsiW